MSGWNFADVWEAVAETLPDADRADPRRPPLHVAEFDERADGIGQWLLGIGGRAQDKVAQYLYNCPEYLESMFGILKAGTRSGQHELPLRRRRAAVPVGQRRRRRRDLPRHVHRAHRRAARPSCPRSRVGCGSTTASGACPEWADPYEDAANLGNGRCAPPWGRDGDDLYMLYTGGTTGMPKGVMWRQDDIFATLNGTSDGVKYPDDGTLDDVRTLLDRAGQARRCPRARSCTAPARSRASPRSTPAAASSRSPSAPTRPRNCSPPSRPTKVNVIAIVGDAFAKPMLRALDAEPGPLGHLVAVRDGQLRRDVERGDQAGPAQAPRRRCCASTRSRRPKRWAWVARSRPRRRGAHGQVHARRERQGDHRRRQGRRARVRRDRHGRGEGSHAGRLLQGPGEERRHVQGDRRRALFDPRRLRHGRGRRHPRPARSRLGVHQHRRREGVSRRGRRGPQDRDPCPRRGRGRRA